MNGIIGIVLGLAALCLVLHLLAKLVQVPVVARVFGEMPWLPAETCGPTNDGEPVQFLTRDGVCLSGSYLLTTAIRRRGVIIFCHELNGDRWTALPYTRELLQRGFDILTFDFRNHGQSGRMAGYDPMPWVTTHEVLDVQAAIDFLVSRADGEKLSIGLLGISRGGTAAFCAAARDSRVSAVAIDGMVPAEQMQVQYARRVLRKYVWPSVLADWVPTVALRFLGSWAKLVIARRYQCQMVNVNQAARHNRRPVLMIHANEDSFISVQVVRKLHAAMRKHARLWIVPRARHGRSIVAASEQYHRRLMRFFTTHLDKPAPVLVRLHAPLHPAELSPARLSDRLLLPLFRIDRPR